MTDNHAPLPTPLFYREAGSGPGVVCIHCNGSSSSQWRPLMDRLAPRHRVLAPDTHGAGRGPAWPTDRPLTLRDEVTLLEAALAQDLPLPDSGPTPIRLAVNADSLATWIIPALAACEGMLFDLVIDDQEYSQDWLRRGEVAGAITAHPGPLQGCDTLPLGRLRYHATADRQQVNAAIGADIDLESAVVMRVESDRKHRS